MGRNLTELWIPRRDNVGKNRNSKISQDDTRILKKLNKLVEENNFLFESWLPLIEQLHDKRLKNFLNASRNYIIYLSTVKHEGKLPRSAYELAFREIKNDRTLMRLVEPLIKKVEHMRSNIKPKKN